MSIVDLMSDEKKKYFMDNLSSLNWKWVEWEKFTGISQKTLRSFAKSRGILKKKVLSETCFVTKWTEEKEKILEKFYNQYSLKELEEALGLSDWCIYEKLKEKGLTKTFKKTNRKLFLTEEVKKELLNPYLSNEEIARDHGVSSSCVAIYRKQLGISMGKLGMSRNRPSCLEIQVMSLLDELDLAYILNKKIRKENDEHSWEIDFYLGNKLGIEVNGFLLHSRDFSQERDIRKVDYLESLGYKILYITDFDLIDRSAILQKISNFVASHFSNGVFKKQGERMKKRCNEETSSLLTVNPTINQGNTVPRQLDLFNCKV